MAETVPAPSDLQRDLIGPSSVSLTNQVMKLCGKMVEAGQAYNAANQLFLTGLAELSAHNKTDDVITVRS